MNNKNNTNTKANTIFAKIHDYLEGRISAEDFSYDFPVTYSLYASECDRENPKLSAFIQKELVNLCQRFDPFDMYNIKDKIIDESVFRSAVKEAAETAKKINSRA